MEINGNCSDAPVYFLIHFPVGTCTFCYRRSVKFKAHLGYCNRISAPHSPIYTSLHYPELTAGLLRLQVMLLFSS